MKNKKNYCPQHEEKIQLIKVAPNELEKKIIEEACCQIVSASLDVYECNKCGYRTFFENNRKEVLK